MKIIRKEEQIKMKETLEEIEDLARKIYAARLHISTEDDFSKDRIIADSILISSLARRVKEFI